MINLIMGVTSSLSFGVNETVMQSYCKAKLKQRKLFKKSIFDFQGFLCGTTESLESFEYKYVPKFEF